MLIRLGGFTYEEWLYPLKLAYLDQLKFFNLPHYDSLEKFVLNFSRSRNIPAQMVREFANYGPVSASINVSREDCETNFSLDSVWSIDFAILL